MTALLRPMVGRDTREAHRASTPLELFFDLTFVVGISFAAEGFAQEVAVGHTGFGLLSYLMVFFAIWWGWLNFTWFASAYDTDDWLYRLVTLVQMAGALVVAAGVPRALESRDYDVVVIGYLIMRLAMVFQWLRAAHRDETRRGTALRFAVGITVVQVFWVLRLALPASLGVVSFVVLAAAELAVPIWAERRQRTTYHFGHLSERYGLFTLIVLGEGVLAAARSAVAAIEEGEHIPELATLAASGLVIIAGMWWLYFQVEPGREPGGLVGTISWGYGHVVVFAAAGAVSAGLEVQIERVLHETETPALLTGLTLALPVAVFVLMVWLLVVRPHLDGRSLVAGLAAAVLIALTGLVQVGAVAETAAVAVLIVALVVGLVVATRSAAASRLTAG